MKNGYNWESYSGITFTFSYFDYITWIIYFYICFSFILSIKIINHNGSDGIKIGILEKKNYERIRVLIK